ncbi:MAG: acyl-protein synthetase, partial [Polyangiaceae bacterium]|nr:acyl-protein synthetase [Polyangiaceae bacterium]
QALGIAERDIVGEYGMTELSSQLYEPRLVDDPPSAPGTYRPPPWLRVEAADPETLAVLPRGSEGIARFVDLANVDSVSFVQTLDWVSVDERGDVRLFGRAPGAEPRGCSLALEDLFGDRSHRGPAA